ncbi:MAG: hypothetical protein QOF02_375 [Blastocatellia bacterium]|jgi:hypothetical protein|nr:hypothetical protein [Blastocatellia bacterium]
MSEQAAADSEMSFITEQEFIKLCDELYADRHQLYAFNPNIARREAVLWMLLGCLLSLLSIPDAEQSGLLNGASADPYAAAVSELLRTRMRPPFEPQVHLAELSKKIASEEPNEIR